MKTTADAKIELESMGFPCFYGEALSYVQIANIFKNKKLGLIKYKDGDCSECEYNGGLSVRCKLPSLTPCPADMQNDITYPGSIE